MASSYSNYYYYPYHYDYYQDKNESRPPLKKSLSTGTGYGYDMASRDLMDEMQEIDPSCNEHLDGEPMNELELLAAKNAIINSKITKIVYTPTDNEQDEELTSIEQEFLNPTNGDNNESPVTLVTDKEKKKRWPFSLLFKKAKQDIIYNYETNRSTHIIPDSNNKSNDGNSINSSASSSNSSSNVPTPTLSPLSSTSPLSSSSSSSPFSVHRGGVWVFRAPSTGGVVYWIRFDPENQQKITRHFHSKNMDALYIFDSHLCRGQLPVLVLPFQKLCYYALDYTVSQVACLQLAYLPYSVAGELSRRLAHQAFHRLGINHAHNLKAIVQKYRH
ncbi:hypothetical protein RMATCC62417_14292 [Rhizopus microsporus]|nr:hypothetical protein RMATCC62417_14292 [Rhizopus microsporus]